MKYCEAREKFVPKIFPFGKLYFDECFDIFKIGLDFFENPDIFYRSKVEDYKTKIESNVFIEPVWGSLGRKMKDSTIQLFWNRKIQIKDGNHRIAAFKELNKKNIETIMPISHYRIYVKEFCGD